MWKSPFPVMDPWICQISTVPIHRGPALCSAAQPRHERKNVPIFLKCFGDGPERQGSQSANSLGNRLQSAVSTWEMLKTGFDHVWPRRPIECVEMWPLVLPVLHDFPRALANIKIPKKIAKKSHPEIVMHCLSVVGAYLLCFHVFSWFLYYVHWCSLATLCVDR